MFRVAQAEAVPDGFAAAVSLFIRVDVQRAVQFAVHEDLQFTAVGEVRAHHDGAGALEFDGGGGALVGGEFRGTARGLPLARELPAWVADGDALHRRAVIVPDFELRSLGLLGPDGDTVAFRLAAGLADQRECAFLGALHNAVEGMLGELEFLAGERRDAALIEIGNRAVAQHDAENAAGAGGIAVGILAGARGDLDGFAEIAFAVEQAQSDIGAVEFGVDIETA